MAEQLEIDQSQESMDWVIGENGAIYWEAQSFQLASAKSVTSVAVKLGTSFGGGGGSDIRYRLETNNAGNPSGTLVDANATADLTPTYSDWNKVSFPSAIPLLGATTYWLVVKYSVDPSAGKGGRVRAKNPSVYADGYLDEYSGSWNSYGANTDMTFRIYTQVAATTARGNMTPRGYW